MPSDAIRQAMARLDKVETLDLAKAMPELARGTQGLIRSKMPQVDDLSAFTKWLKGIGIDSEPDSVAAEALKPTRKHFKTEKVKGMVEAIGKGEKGMKKPILVARGKIIDGHHRWAAYRAVGPGESITVISVDAEPKEVMRMAKEYGSRTEKLAAAFDNAITAGDADMTADDQEQPDRSKDEASVRGVPTANGLGDWFEQKKNRRREAAKESERLYGDDNVSTFDG